MRPIFINLLLFLITVVSGKSQIPDNAKWTVYEIGDIGEIAIPPTLELRDESSIVTLYVDNIRDYVYERNYERKKVDITKLVKPQLTFQPQGMDNLDKTAFSKYARVILKYQQGKKGDFYKWNEKFNFSSSELKEIDNYAKQQVRDEITMMGVLTVVKLIKWYPIEYVTINELSCMKISYTRQMENEPIVRVDKYRFFNSSEIVEFTVSYRMSESNIWASDFNKIAGTFSFKSKK
jgi:hypothetical protein